MRSFRSVTFGLIAAVAGVAVASDVHDLKADTFLDFVGSNDLVLAEFFAPWCGHCKALAPEYEEAATTLKEKNIALAKVDCTEQADLCKDYGVEGYPTLKIFRGKDDVKPYNGQRKAPAIVSYMVKQSLPAVSSLTSDTIEDFKTQDKVVVVAYHESSDKATNQTFTKLADSLRDTYLFGATNDADLAKDAGVKAPAIVLYKQFDEGKVIYNGDLTEDEIDPWIKQASIPLIGEIGPETFQDYMAAGVPLAYIFAETPEEREQFTKEFKSVAEKVRGKLNIGTIDAKAFGQHGSNLNLEVGNWPAFAIQDTVTQKKFPFEGTGAKFDVKAIGKFVDDFVAGKIEPSIKSEPIPDKQEGPVTVIVAKNYDDIVLDNKKDVLVEFYAPWCGHCKALAPKYEELATAYAKHADQVTIAKVDATANDVPDEIQGFPTIKLYKAGDKENPISYSGDRSIEDLIRFIAESGKHKISVEYEEAAASSKVAGAAETMQEAAAAATEGAKEAAHKVAEAVEAAVGDSGDDHDEL